MSVRDTNNHSVHHPTPGAGGEGDDLTHGNPSFVHYHHPYQGAPFAFVWPSNCLPPYPFPQIPAGGSAAPGNSVMLPMITPASSFPAYIPGRHWSISDGTNGSSTPLPQQYSYCAMNGVPPSWANVWRGWQSPNAQNAGGGPTHCSESLYNFFTPVSFRAAQQPPHPLGGRRSSLRTAPPHHSTRVHHAEVPLPLPPSQIPLPEAKGEQEQQPPHPQRAGSILSKKSSFRRTHHQPPPQPQLQRPSSTAAITTPTTPTPPPPPLARSPSILNRVSSFKREKKSLQDSITSPVPTMMDENVFDEANDNVNVAPAAAEEAGSPRMERKVSFIIIDALPPEYSGAPSSARRKKHVRRHTSQHEGDVETPPPIAHSNIPAPPLVELVPEQEPLSSCEVVHVQRARKGSRRKPRRSSASSLASYQSLSSMRSSNAGDAVPPAGVLPPLSLHNSRRTSTFENDSFFHP